MNIHSSNYLENKENVYGGSKGLPENKALRIFGTDITNSSIEQSQEFSPDPFKLDYYSRDIFTYLHSIETINSPNPEYLKSQADINERMRAILIDWLTQVHLKYRLAAETLFLTINILDRYLEKISITKSRLQLVGITSLFIASKFEDVCSPDIEDMVFITDKTYDRDMIINMEASILKTLDFNISNPSILLFLERYCALIGEENRNIAFAKYLVELTLVDYKMLRYKKSLIAASAIYLMHKIMSVQPQWPQVLERNSSYKEENLKSCAKDLCILLQRAPQITLQSVRKKFMLPAFYSVAYTQIPK